MSAAIDTLYHSAHDPTSPVGKMYGLAAGVNEGNDIHGGPVQKRINVDPNFGKEYVSSGGKAADDAYWAKVAPGLSQDQIATVLRTLPPDQAQTLINGSFANLSQQLQPDSALDKWMQRISLAMSVGALTAGFGATAGAAVGSSVGGTAGAVAGGAATGAFGAAAQGLLTQGNLNAKQIGMGALGGGIAGGASGLTKAISDSTGLNPTLAGGVVKTGAGALTGAIGGALSGQGAGAGALSGAEHGAISAGTGAVAGSIFNSGNTIPTSGSTDISNNTNPNMSDDYFDPTNGGMYGPDLSGSTNVSDPYGAGTIDYSDPMSGMGGETSPNGGYLTADQLGGGGSNGGGNSSLLGALSKLLGGSSGGSISPGMIQSLLGTLAKTGGGIFDSNAAKGAAGTYANQTKFNPYNINGPNGSTSFNGTTATQTLSPQQQQLQAMLSKLGLSAGAGLAAGPGAASDAYFKSLQAQDRDSNNKSFQSNLDSQFANGILGSTAGSYQSKAALDAINQKTSADQVMAQQFGQNQQQQQLQQLTGSLNGMNGMSQQQLQQLFAGFSGGADASGANSKAYQPVLAANSNSTIGNLLTNLGNTAGG